jgi:hypothetical protein
MTRGKKESEEKSVEHMCCSVEEEGRKGVEKLLLLHVGEA